MNPTIDPNPHGAETPATPETGTFVFANGTPARVETFVSERLRERYYRTVHPSGLTVYFFPKDLSVTAALYATRFGGADVAYLFEGDERETVLPRGCAHFLEHKMFEEADGSDAFTYFSALGASANAYTSWDKTAYLFHATSNERECLETLLSFVSSPHFTEENVKKEQGIIAEEIRMGEDTPGEVCFMNALRAAYRENGIREEICGSEASIAEITPEILYECCRVFYHPSNMVLTVAGNLSLAEVLETVDRVYALLPQNPPPARRLIRRDENRNETASVVTPRVETRMQVGKPLFTILLKDHAAVALSPKDRLKREATVSLLREILFSSSSELYNRLVEDGTVSTGFSAGYDATGFYAFLDFEGESDDPDRVLAEVRETLLRAKNEGIDPEAFERARRVRYARAVKSFNKTRTVAELLLDCAFRGGELFEEVEGFDTLTVRDVEALLPELCREDAFTLSVVSPLPEEECGDGFEGGADGSEPNETQEVL